MNTFNLSNNLSTKFEEIFSIQPNDLGPRPLTTLYKIITRRFKTMPFKYILPLSIFAAVWAYILLGPLVIKLTTMLQYGF